MKTIGKLAIVFAVLFFVFIVSGGILTSIGVGKAAADTDLRETLESIINNYTTDYDLGWANAEDGQNYNAATEVCLQEGVSNIVLANMAGDVSVTEGRGDVLIIKCNGFFINVPSMLTYETGAVSDTDIDVPLNIVVREKEVVIKMFSGEIIGSHRWGDIDIILPAGYRGSVELENIASSTEFENVQLESLSLKNCPGSIEVSNSTIGELKAENIAGEVVFDGWLDTVKLEHMLGSVEIESDSFMTGDSLISSCLGRVEIELPVGNAVKMNANGNLGAVMCTCPQTGSAAQTASFSVINNLGEIFITNED